MHAVLFPEIFFQLVVCTENALNNLGILQIDIFQGLHKFPFARESFSYCLQFFGFAAHSSKDIQNSIRYISKYFVEFHSFDDLILGMTLRYFTERSFSKKTLLRRIQDFLLALQAKTLITGTKLKTYHFEVRLLLHRLHFLYFLLFFIYNYNFKNLINISQIRLSLELWRPRQQASKTPYPVGTWTPGSKCLHGMGWLLATSLSGAKLGCVIFIQI